MSKKIDHIKALVDQFDKEDVDSGMFEEAQSKVTNVLGSLDPDQLQITRLINIGGDVKLQKFFVKA